MRKIIILLLIPSFVIAGTWTATVTSQKSDNQGNQIVGLHFDNGQGQTYDVDDHIPFDSSSTQLNDFVATVESGIDSQMVVFSSAPSLGQTVTPSVSVIAIPDTNAAVKSSFSSEWLQLKQMQVAINHGLKTTADLDYIALLSKVKSDFISNQSILLPLMREGI